MAVFQFNNLKLAYYTEFAPFSHDLLLLHGSRMTPEFWRPVLDDLKKSASSGGRVVTCEWNDVPQAEDQADFFARFIETLGMHDVHVVAIGDATKLVGKIQKVNSGLIKETLMFPQGGPKDDELVRAVCDFCDI